ncbi:unnamed protein product [Linum trigynum]|uniref:Uncharacterized protein n=1 Tax=Linum trigynum TaxID=586398 RepID=A0AAV2FGH5_9ROSI
MAMVPIALIPTEHFEYSHFTVNPLPAQLHDNIPRQTVMETTLPQLMELIQESLHRENHPTYPISLMTRRPSDGHYEPLKANDRVYGAWFSNPNVWAQVRGRLHLIVAHLPVAPLQDRDMDGEDEDEDEAGVGVGVGM